MDRKITSQRTLPGVAGTMGAEEDMKQREKNDLSIHGFLGNGVVNCIIIY